MRIAPLVLGQGYMPVAVTTSDTKNGCWSLGTDLIRIQEVLDCQLLKTKALPKVHTSSGVDLAELLFNGLAQGALVMVNCCVPTNCSHNPFKTLKLEG
eukprot:scaffold5730_cov55-Cyclotella_meneghiniana.AAC.12